MERVPANSPANCGRNGNRSYNPITQQRAAARVAFSREFAILQDFHTNR